MSGILSPHTNEPVSIVKRSHNPERIAANREQMDKQLAPLLQGYVQDMQNTKLGGTMPNETAVYEHYDSEWRAACMRMSKSSEPIDCDPEAFAKHITAHKEQMARAELSQTPLFELSEEQREKFDMVSLDVTSLGEILLSDSFAVLMDKNGTCYLHIPDIGTGDDWPLFLVQSVEDIVLPYHMKKTGLRTVDIATLMQSLGRKMWSKPSPQQVIIAGQRELMQGAARKWWNPSTW